VVFDIIDECRTNAPAKCYGLLFPAKPGWGKQSKGVQGDVRPTVEWSRTRRNRRRDALLFPDVSGWHHAHDDDVPARSLRGAQTTAVRLPSDRQTRPSPAEMAARLASVDPQADLVTMRTRVFLAPPWLDTLAFGDFRYCHPNSQPKALTRQLPPAWREPHPLFTDA